MPPPHPARSPMKASIGNGVRQNNRTKEDDSEDKYECVI